MEHIVEGVSITAIDGTMFILESPRKKQLNTNILRPVTRKDYENVSHLLWSGTNFLNQPHQHYSHMAHLRRGARSAKRSTFLVLAPLLLSVLIDLPKTAAQSINGLPGDPQKRFPFYDQLKDPLLLTPFIMTGDLEYGRNLSRVNGFKQIAGDLESYSGFLTVNETHFSNIFFWYFPAETLVSLGYSFTAPAGRPKSLAESTEDLYAALVQFYALFPVVSVFPLYLTGQSYSGKFVPSLARKIGTRNKALRANQRQSSTVTSALRLQMLLPLEGIIIGNPMIHPKQNFHYGDFLFGHGLIDEVQRNHFELRANESVQLADEGKWEESVDVMDQLIFGAFRNDTYFKRVTGFDQYHSVRGPRDTYLFTPSYAAADAFLSSVTTRRNLHVGEMPFFSFSEETLRNFKGDMAQSQLENLEFALDNYRVMLYYGSLDIICNFEAGRRIINDARRWNRYEEWLRTNQKPWKAKFADLVRYGFGSGHGDTMPPSPANVNDEVTFGYVTQLPKINKSRNDFVFLVVLGAAHSALQDRPEIMQHAVDTFLRHGKF
ncbi:unnamed protein product [Notodromas monacha]|uniref:Serine carboxypeptidase n=1 Tax=Notodromas monacha TaxID=399045 RepID=A0A7R9BKF0_9CRUS|nr:unnamed protein product [Notodromas monacha]CAG0915790.1 unnamed protein product [Notodromas monacha]